MQNTVSSDPLPLGLRHAGFVGKEIEPAQKESLAQVLEPTFQSAGEESVNFELYSIPFYRHYQLLRVIEKCEEGETDTANQKEAYALVKFARVGGAVNASVIPLNGKSDPIHWANVEAGNLTFRDGIENFEEAHRSYIFFFTWAVHGAEGNFSIVLSKDELAQELANTEGGTESIGDALDAVKFGLFRQDDSRESQDDSRDSQETSWVVTVTYSNVLFESSFKVLQSGAVEMVSDKPLLELPVPVNDNYDRADRFVLQVLGSVDKGGAESSEKESSNLSSDLPLGLRHAGLIEEEIENEQEKSIDQVLIDDFRYEKNRKKIYSLYSTLFYKNYKLLRIKEDFQDVENSTQKKRAAFALVKFSQEGGQVSTSLLPLDGTSPVIHEVNAEEGNLHLSSDEEDGGLSERFCGAYLRFFTWAICGNEGNFSIVESKDEMGSILKARGADLSGESSGKLLGELAKVDFDVSRDRAAEEAGDEQETDSMRFSAKIAYSLHLFASEFRVLSTGMVEMVSDTPILNIPVAVNSSFDRDDRFVLRKAGQYRRPGIDSKIGVGLEEVSAETFSQDWCSGNPSNCKVSDKVLLIPDSTEDESMLSCRQKVTVSNCVFEKSVTIKSGRTDLVICFERCHFAGGLDLAGCEIAGFLEFSDCLIEELDSAKESRLALCAGIDLKGASIGALRMVRCGISGRFFARSLKVERNLTIQGCRVGTEEQEVTCPVVLSEIGEWPGRSFKDQIEFDFGIASIAAFDLSGSRIGGDLEISAAVPVESGVECSAAQELCTEIRGTWSESHKRVNGLIISAVRGDCHIRNTQIGGNLFLFGFGCTGALDLAGAAMSSLTTVPDAIFQWKELQKISSIWPFCWFGRMQGPIRVSGHTQLASVDTKIVLFENSSFGGGLDLLSTRVQGDLRLFFAEVKGWGTAFHTSSLLGDPSRPALEVKGDINFRGSEIATLDFRGIRVGGRLAMGNSKIGTLRVGFGWIREKEVFRETSGDEEEDDETLQWRIRPVYSSFGSIDISGLDVVNDMSLAGIEVAPNASFGDESKVNITQSKIGGDLRFASKRSLISDLGGNLPRENENIPWADPPSGANHKRRVAALKAINEGEGIHENQPSILDYPVKIAGDLNLEANQIDGHLDLGNVRVPDGKILLNDSNIGLDLNMSAQLERGPDPIGYSLLTTCCLGLDMEKIVIGGDADLTGLRITKNGDLLARDALVRGDILLLPEKSVRESLKADDKLICDALAEFDSADDDEAGNCSDKTDEGYGNARRCYAQIDGELDLIAVEAARVLISGHNVANPEKNVRISRAKLGRLEILEPTPGPLDLTRTEVARWSVDDNELPTARQFAEVFKKLKPFDRANWVNVETRLRNEMQTGEANKLYRAMRRMTRVDKIEREKSSLIRAISKNPIWWLKDGALWLIGWGTLTWIPFAIWIPCFVAFCFVLSESRNVQAGADMLQRPDVAKFVEDSIPTNANAEGLEVQSSNKLYLRQITPSETGASWGLLDGTLLAARYGIPVANLFVHDRWEASSSPKLHVGEFRLVPEHLGGYLAVLGWIAWPLWLIGLARAAVRDKQS